MLNFPLVRIIISLNAFAFRGKEQFIFPYLLLVSIYCVSFFILSPYYPILTYIVEEIKLGFAAYNFTLFTFF